MNFTRNLLNAFLIAVVILLISACCGPKKETQKSPDEFTFAFLTDIHVQPEKNATEGFRKAIQAVNELSPDFVITGGDLIMDALGQSFGRSDSLYNIYTGMLEEFNMPVYNTPGNHEIYGWYARSGADTNHPEYGKKMFESRIGPRYQRIDRNGWIFFILDSVVKNGKGGYEGGVDAEELAWLKDQLATIPDTVPIAISVHIPLITLEAQLLRGATEANSAGEVIVNSKEVLDLFKDHNLKLVLQGHLHYYETMHAFGTDYITAGSVAAAWWEGPFYGIEEGFLLVKVKDGVAMWEYIDYGWEANL